MANRTVRPTGEYALAVLLGSMLACDISIDPTDLEQEASEDQPPESEIDIGEAEPANDGPVDLEQEPDSSQYPEGCTLHRKASSPKSCSTSSCVHTVTCNSGASVMSGGCDIDNGNSSVKLHSSRRYATIGWACITSPSTDSSYTLEAFALCC